MERSVRAGKPFFLYYPITQIHFPTLAHPDFAGKTGAGDIGDAMADVDYNTGLVLDAIERLGIERDTIVIWMSDNGAEIRRPWRGTAGPWTGFYNTVMEGGVRTPRHDPLAGPHSRRDRSRTRSCMSSISSRRSRQRSVRTSCRRTAPSTA